MITYVETGKATDKVGLCQTCPEYTTLWTIKAGTGDGDAVMESVNKMF